MKKLLIRENAITDLRHQVNNLDFSDIEDKYSGYYKREYSPYSRYGRKGAFVPSDKTIKQGLITWLENTLKNNYDFDFNADQLELVPISKPKSSVAAKKNPNLLIGIDSSSGDAVIIGRGEFYAYYSGKVDRADKGSYHSTGVPEDPNPDYEFKNHRVNLRDNFDYFDIWFELIEPEGYQKRSDIRKGRGGVTTYTSNDRKYLDKQIYNFERELYDPDVAREKYAYKLKAIKTRKQYEDILNSIDTVNERIRNIDFGHPIFDDIKVDERDIKDLKNEYKNLVYYVNELNDDIENNHDWSIDSHAEWAKKALDAVNNILTNKFEV